MSNRLMALAAIATLALAGCGDGMLQAPGPSEPVALVLQAPDDSTGALVLTITGGPIDSVVAGTAMLHGVIDASRTSADVVILGAMPAGATVATLYMPDAAAKSSYVITVNEAANGTTYAQRPAGALTVTTN